MVYLNNSLILKKSVSKKRFYIEYFKSLQPVLSLSDKEIEILAEIAKISTELQPVELFSKEDKEKMLLNADSRKKICNAAKVKIHHLNNIISNLKSKNVLVATSNGYKIHQDIVIPSINDSSFSIVYVIETE